MSARSCEARDLVSGVGPRGCGLNRYPCTCLAGVVTPPPRCREARHLGAMLAVMALTAESLGLRPAPRRRGPSGIQMESVDSPPAQQVPGGVQR